MERGSRRERLRRSFRKAVRSLWNAVPIIATVVLLLGLFRTYVSPELLRTVFSTVPIVDVVVGVGIGSISTGNPITSYIVGGELLKQGVSLVAVTAFIVSWVTVGIVQFPAEASILGRRFAIVRNVTSAVLAVVVSYVTVLLVTVIA